MFTLCHSLRNSKSDIKKALEMRQRLHENKEENNCGEIRKIPHKFQLVFLSTKLSFGNNSDI